MTRLDGHDGSHWQLDAGPVDMVALRAATWWFAWKRFQGLTGIDRSFDVIRPQADEADFPIKLGYHWLSAPPVNPITQAEKYLDSMGSFGLWGCLLDAEEAGVTEAACLAFFETVEDHLRRPSAGYTGLYVTGGTIWKSQALRESAYGPRPWDVAAYVSEQNLMLRMVQTQSLPDFPFDAWQFGSNGPVPGITGRADMNRIDNRARYNAVCGLSTPTPIPTPDPQEEHPMLDGFVQDDSPEHHFWARGIDYDYAEGRWRRWACLIDAIDVDWNLYQEQLKEVPEANLKACQRVPFPPPAPISPGGLTRHIHEFDSAPGRTGEAIPS